MAPRNASEAKAENPLLSECMIVNGVPDNMWEDASKMLGYLTAHAVPVEGRRFKNEKSEAKKLASDMIRNTYTLPIGGLLIWILFNPSLWSLAFKLAYWWLFKR